MLRYGWIILASALVIGCQTRSDKHTIAQLRNVDPDLRESRVDDSLAKALESYRRFLSETPGHRMAPEAMRRMADLQIEKDYGVIGNRQLIELPAPAQSQAPPTSSKPLVDRNRRADDAETDENFEQRTTRRFVLGEAAPQGEDDVPHDVGSPVGSGPREAIATYKQILADYPWYERNDQVLYQMARAHDELAEPDEAMKVAMRLIEQYPDSRYIDEVYFRRAEFFFVRKKYLDAEYAYQSVVAMGDASSFYELALYKLGWSLYKQELYEDALHQYIALLDYKLSVGYDFDQTYQEEQERRVADTFRVVSLSFSNLGGAEFLGEYFSRQGNRIYEDRIYRNLAEFHLTKRRFNDAASVYQSFVELNLFHPVAPHFSMRVSEIYAEGNFPLLVVKSKRDFANRYGMDAEYWRHFDIEAAPDVLAYLKTNLKDLANHYHALYQHEGLQDDKRAEYREALRWYGEYLESFPQDVESPQINYQLADLLLEEGDFARSALEYERTAYSYPLHGQASAAGYAAIYAHRENLSVVDGALMGTAKRATIESSLRFADAFPDHENAPPVLGAAAEDLYEIKDFEQAITSAQQLIDRYQDAEASLRRSAWSIVAHSSFDLARYAQAEHGYSEVLEITEAEDEAWQPLVDNLAASIFKQGEQARLLDDYAAAADHFLRIKSVAPTSEIRSAAEYDAAAALIYLENWTMAAQVLEEFRRNYPEHELRTEATKQLASVYREAGELSLSAGEYEKVAEDTDDPELRRNAVLLAGELYEEAHAHDDTLRIYRRYMDEFPRPLDTALEIRFKVAGMHESVGDKESYLDELEHIVTIERDAGPEQTERSRYLAAQSSLVLTERLYDEFAALRLNLPFEDSLSEKQRLMDVALKGFERLVQYEVAEVTAAATFYIAEAYYQFSSAIVESERPSDLSQADLADYEMVIEEEAYPFEERSIDVHRENLELMSAGVFNGWVQRSLDRLAEVMPGRYAKYEISSGFVGSIDFYAYRSPSPPVEGLESETGEDPITSVLTEPWKTQVDASPAAEIAGIEDVVPAF